MATPSTPDPKDVSPAVPVPVDAAPATTDPKAVSPAVPATPALPPGSRRETLKTIVILLIAAGVLGVVFATSLGWEIPGLTTRAEAAKKQQEAPLKVELVKERDLQLLKAVKDVGQLPKEGKNLIVVANVQNVLYFRIFDGVGNVVVQTDETKLTKQAEPIAKLKKQLEQLGSPHVLTEEEDDQVYKAVTSIVGYTLLTHTMSVPEEVRLTLGMRKGDTDVVEIARLPTINQTLELPGSTALNPAKIARLRIRFPTNGTEVLRIGKMDDPLVASGVPRELRPGDTVIKGQELVVFDSVDVGSKKNDLIDAICQLKLDQEIYDRALEARSAIPEVFVLNAQRAVAGDNNAINRAVKNLETWGVPKEDIDAVRKEAEALSKIQKEGKRPPIDPEKEKLWGHVTVRSPIDGVIVERNVTEKEIIVDNTINVFQIANVDDLLVLANAPEDQLLRLRELKQNGSLNWSIQTVGAVRYAIGQKALETWQTSGLPVGVLDKLKSLKDITFETRESFEAELARILAKDDRERWQKNILDAAKTSLVGPVDEISYLIDPNMHTAILKGFIKNKQGALRGGQYVTATIELPKEKNVVEVPMAAIADDGRQTVVFLQKDPTKPNYTMVRVKVTHRFDKVAYVRSVLSDNDVALGLTQAKEQGLLPFSPLNEGDRVITSGLLLLKKELDDRESALAATTKP